MVAKYENNPEPSKPAGYKAGEGADPAPARGEAERERRMVRAYQAEVDAGCKAYDKWNSDFNCDKLEDYYTGLGHWSEEERGNYTINLCFAGVEIRIPSLLFYNPHARIKPRPGRADDPGTAIDERAKLLEDTAQTFIDQEEVGFMDATVLALKESQYRFGMVRVGYTADYIDNPNAGKPALDKTTGEPMIGTDDKPVLEGPYLLGEESLYVKRIPANQFRVPAVGRNVLHHNDWLGYYEFVELSDVQANPRYKDAENVKSTAKMRDEYATSFFADDDEKVKASGRAMVKLWHCWDTRQKLYYVWADGAKAFLLKEPYKFLPFAGLKFHDRMDEYYPLPPLFNWTSPQDELNETRQMQRIHRRRFKRRYVRLRNFCRQEEWDKLEQGDDGVCVEVNNLDGMRPVEDAQLDPAVARNIPATKDDFMRITGIGGEQQAVPQSSTATQSAIIDANLRIRETYAKAIVGRWLARVIKLMIMTARDRMALPMWIERNVDPLGPGAQEEVMRVATTWAAITHKDLGDFDFDVSVDVQSLAPTQQNQDRQDFMQVLGLVTQPQMAVLLSNSEVLLRRVLELHNIRDARDVSEIRQAVQITAIAMAQMQGGPGPGGGAPGPGAPGRRPTSRPTPAPGPVPSQGNIMSQLMGQIGLNGPVAPGGVH